MRECPGKKARGRRERERNGGWKVQRFADVTQTRILYTYLLRKGFGLFNHFFPSFSFSVPAIDTITTVEGHPAELPCDIRPPNDREQVYLVLWYRQDEGEPIYR